MMLIFLSKKKKKKKRKKTSDNKNISYYLKYVNYILLKYFIINM